MVMSAETAFFAAGGGGGADVVGPVFGFLAGGCSPPEVTGRFMGSGGTHDANPSNMKTTKTTCARDRWPRAIVSDTRRKGERRRERV